jgi:DNA polymerase-3 subunit gamma/tau
VQQEAVESMLGSISRDFLVRLFDALADQSASVLLQEARLVIEHNPDYQRVCAEMIALLQQLALYQSDPKLINEDEYGEELLQKYSTRWSAEEIQLYYQILLQGRQDLLISPDEASGFEMLMLRLLAFSPQIEGQEANIEQPEVKKKPEVKPHLADPANDQETSRPETPACVQATPDPQAKTSDAASPEPDLQTKDQADADMPLDWYGLAYQLGLTGLAQEIVANSRLKSYRDGNLRLELLPEIHELATDLIKTEIRRALEQKLEVSLQLDLAAAASLAGQTPLQAKELRQQQQRLAAIDAIRQEKTVRKLQHAFAAELDETSVVKIENNS